MSDTTKPMKSYVIYWTNILTGGFNSTSLLATTPQEAVDKLRKRRGGDNVDVVEVREEVIVTGWE